MIPAIPQTIPRRALVTGGARRLGRALALALAEAGFAVAIHARRADSTTDETLEAIGRAGQHAACLAADLGEEDALAPLLGQAAGALGGPLGVLVNNASLFERDEWHDATASSWSSHLAVNLRAPFVLAQGFARALPEANEGVILNMLDERVWSLTPHFVSYTVSKSGLWSLTRSLALALAPRIRVVGIGPGPALPSPRQSPEQFARQCESLPLRHGTSPGEIGRAAVALLALPSVTGQMLALDGGQHLQWHPAPQGGTTPEE